MQETQTKVIFKGLGLGKLVFLVFLVLKLIHQISWSWWWVTCPLWLPLTVIFSIFLIVGLGYLTLVLCVGIADSWDSHRRTKRMRAGYGRHRVGD